MTETVSFAPEATAKTSDTRVFGDQTITRGEDGYFALSANLDINSGDDKPTGKMQVVLKFNDFPEDVDFSDPTAISMSTINVRQGNVPFPKYGFIQKMKIIQSITKDGQMNFFMAPVEVLVIQKFHMDNVDMAILSMPIDKEIYSINRPGEEMYFSVEFNPMEKSPPSPASEAVIDQAPVERPA